MKKSPFLLRRCDLPGCSAPGAFELASGRVICARHGLMLMVGDEAVQRMREKFEREDRASLPDFNPENPGEPLRDEEVDREWLTKKGKIK